MKREPAKKSPKSPTERPSLFSALLCVLIAMGIVGLSATFFFFVQNQCNINRVFQDPASVSEPSSGSDSSTTSDASSDSSSSTSPEITMDRAEFITRLSEAQTSASTKDILTLLYGFVSTALLTVSLYILSETQKNAKKAHDDLGKTEKKASLIKKNLQSLRGKIEIQNNVLPLQMCIEQAAIDTRAIELDVALLGAQSQPLDLHGPILSRLPRIHDSLTQSEQFIDQLDDPKMIESLKKDDRTIFNTFAKIYRASIDEIGNSFKCLSEKDYPDRFLVNDFTTFYKSCERMKKKLLRYSDE